MEITTPAAVLPQRSQFWQKVLPVSCIIITFLVLVIPFLTSSFSLDLAKKLVLFIGTLALFIFWLFGRVTSGSLEIPRTIFFWFPPFALVTIILSNVFSSNPVSSLSGTFFDNGTTLTLGVLLIVLFLWGLYMRSNKRITAFVVSLYAVFSIVFIVQIAHVFFNLSVPGLALASDTLLGSWNNFGIFSGLILILSLVLIREQSLSTRIRFALFFFLILSMLSLSVVNFYLVWWSVLTVAVLMLLHYLVTASSRVVIDDEANEVNNMNTRAGTDRLVVISSLAITILLCVSFIVWGKETIVNSGTNVSSERGILADWSRAIVEPPLEARPWQSGLVVAVESLKADPLFGTGPNRYFEAWDAYKPSSVQTAPFWNSDFNTSFGFIPTLVVTLGGIGILPWLLAGFVFIRAGLSVLFTPSMSRTGRTNSLDTALFFGVLFLLLIALVYVPEISMLFVTFALTGVFMGRFGTRDDTPPVIISSVEAPMRSFVGIIFVVLLSGLAVTGLYITIRDTEASARFQGAAATFNESNPENNEQFDIAIRAVQKAVRSHPNDYLYRELTRLYMAKLAFNVNDQSAKAEILETRIRESFNGALEASQRAVDADKNQYQNYLARASVFEAAVAMQVPGGALEQTRASYLDALARNPNKPVILYRMSRLELAVGDKVKAETYLKNAVGLKPDYIAALFLLAQISADGGDLPLAIKNLEQVSSLNPEDVNLLFQIGFLKYRNKDFKGAIETLQQARSKQPNFSDAKYFLGLAYARTGLSGLAIKEFEDILLLNPGHKETESILNNLRAGRDPFAGSSLDAIPPEHRPLPPVSGE